MARIPKASAPAGWYVNPDDPSQMRWWDGGQWGAQIRPSESTGLAGATTVASIAYPTEVGDSAVGVDERRDKGTAPDGSSLVVDDSESPNSAATQSLVWGIVGLVFNVVGVPGIVAIIFGIGGLRNASRLARDNEAPAGRRKSIWGISLGIASLIVVAILIGPVASSLLPQSPSLDIPKLQSDIRTSAEKDGLPMKKVVCPPSPKDAFGSTFECFGTLSSGKVVNYTVTVVDNKSEVEWRVSN